MQHYRLTDDGLYHLHEGLPVHLRARPTVSDCVDCGNTSDTCREGQAHARGTSCKTQVSLHTKHAQIALAYYEGHNKLATHGSPEGMMAWAELHNSHSPHKVKVYTFSKETSLEDINAAILIPSVLAKLLTGEKP